VGKVPPRPIQSSRKGSPRSDGAARSPDCREHAPCGKHAVGDQHKPGIRRASTRTQAELDVTGGSTIRPGAGETRRDVGRRGRPADRRHRNDSTSGLAASTSRARRGPVRDMLSQESYLAVIGHRDSSLVRMIGDWQPRGPRPLEARSISRRSVKMWLAPPGRCDRLVQARERAGRESFVSPTQFLLPLYSHNDDIKVVAKFPCCQTWRSLANDRYSAAPPHRRRRHQDSRARHGEKIGGRREAPRFAWEN